MRTSTITTLLLVVFVSAVFCAEYCQLETFKASCKDDEVIIMQNATYGRMSVGRCVRADLGYVGCRQDVLPQADKRCSGKRSCEISVPDEEFESLQPCFSEVKAYLEVDYTCVKVETRAKYTCETCRYGIVMNEPTGLLGSVQTEHSKCGSPECPWIIQLALGQRINVSLVDFDYAYQSSIEAQANRARCRVYATIREHGDTHSSSVCGGFGDMQRNRHVYTSRSHQLEVRIMGQGGAGMDPSRFLLSYEAIGCGELRPPPGGWVSTEKDAVILGCNATGESWEMTCDGNNWVGKHTDCGDQGVSGVSGDEMFHVVDFPSGLSIIIILAIAVAIGIVIFGIGIYFIRRNRRPLPEHMYPPAASPPGDLAYSDVVSKSIYDQRDGRTTDKFRYIERGHEYAHIWEMPLPEKPKNTDTIPPRHHHHHHLPPGGYDYNTATLPTHSHTVGGATFAVPRTQASRPEVLESEYEVQSEGDPRFYQVLDTCD